MNPHAQNADLGSRLLGQQFTKSPTQTAKANQAYQPAQLLEIPSYDSGTLWGNPIVDKNNKSRLTDAFIREEMEIDYVARHQMANFNMFNRYQKEFPEDQLETLIPYIFFVRPDLNIYNVTRNSFANKAIEGDYTFQWLWVNAPHVLKWLAGDLTERHDFIPYLGNKVETLPTFDFAVEAKDITQSFTGFKQFYAGNANASVTGINFSINFRENRNLDTLKLFYAWTYYIDGITRNKFTIKEIYRNNRIADYYTSIYYFLCRPDGQEIVYFQKIVGAFPTTAPMSILSMNRQMNVDSQISIDFAAAYVEHLNPMILSEFNYNARMNSEDNWMRPPTNRVINPVPHYDPNTFHGKTFVGTPYVYSPDRIHFYLMWNDEDDRI